VRLTFVFTAHPTEARRQTTERLLSDVAHVLRRRDRRTLTPLEVEAADRRLRAAIEALFQHAAVRLEPPDVLEFDAVASAVTATVATAAGPQTIAARLLVAADGARSRLRAALGIDARVDDYRQHAIIVNCTTAEPAAGRAFERFMAAGPLAALPLTRNRIAIVWTQPETAAERILGLSDADFRAELQAAFGWRLGRIRQVGARDRHRLQRVRSENLIGERTVLIGNAANALHPVAGQGFNLALRDVAALAELLADALAAGAADIGAAAVLGAYRDWRAADQRRLTSFTHALVQGFGASLPGLATARGLGLVAFDLLPGAKSLLARHTMGLAGRVPRLARRLDLA
jgi:2-octaprenyl-6-methoxyphenol hydroxylase